MTKFEIIDQVCEHHGNLSRREACFAVDTIFKTIKEAFLRGENIQIRGFGSFHIWQGAARQGRNLKTGEWVPIASRQVLSFKPASRLKQRVNQR